MEATRYTKGKDFCLDINPLLFPDRIDDQKKKISVIEGNDREFLFFIFHFLIGELLGE